MDTEQPTRGASGSLSAVRAAVVLVVFVVAVVVLVAVGTRPTPSSTASTTSTTTTTSASTSTTTTAAAGGASSTTTTAKSGHRGGTSTTTSTVPPSSVSVVVANATGATGLAAHYTATIGAGGWSMKTPVDASTTEATSAVYYAAGMQQPAASIATAIGVKPTQVLPITTATPVNGVTGTDVVVVIGQDLATSSTSTSS